MLTNICPYQDDQSKWFEFIQFITSWTFITVRNKLKINICCITMSGNLSKTKNTIMDRPVLDIMSTTTQHTTHAHGKYLFRYIL